MPSSNVFAGPFGLNATEIQATLDAAGGVYVKKAGDTMTGSLVLTNNIPLQWQDTGGTARNVLVANSGGGLELVNNSGGTGGPIQFISGATEIFRSDGSNGVQVASGQRFRLGNAYVSGAVTPTGTMVIYDSTGTAYRVSCAV